MVASRLAIALFTAVIVVVFSAKHPSPSYASCSGYFSDVTPPQTIRIYHNNPLKGADYQIYTRDFKTYVKESLPLEWDVGWQQASLQAGAIAVKQFAWDWVNNSPGGPGCYDVDSTTNFQVWAPCPGPYCNTTVATNYAVEQIWNWLLNRSGAIYPTFYKAGYSSDACGYFYGDRQANMDDIDDGNEMSQNGTQACAVAPGPYQYSWAQIVATYYNNFAVAGDHGYGQSHAAMGWGPAPWTPVSISSIGGGSVWNFTATGATSH